MKAVWLFTVALLCAPASHAETVLGMYAGAGSWLQEYDGEVASGISNVDVQDDLALGDDQNNVFYLGVEHPLPVLPNVRLQYTMIEAADRSALTRTLDFNGVIFPDGAGIETLVDMTQGDAVFYYELLDNVFSLDVGMAARWVEGEMWLVSAGAASRAEFEAWLPLLYGKTRVDLPFTGFWISAAAMGVAYDNERVLDSNAQIGWASPYGAGIEFGYRRYELELGEHGELDRTEVDVSGPYVALNLRF